MTRPADDYYLDESRTVEGRVVGAPAASEPPIRAEMVHEGPPRRISLLPVFLFLATCYTTYRVGNIIYPGQGWVYSSALMFILAAHEFGHWIQARRYHVTASLPYFIPIPAPPLGTMGAVISMRGNSWDRKELFDIGISGPLAGLIPAMICCVVGLFRSQVVDLPPPGSGSGLTLGEPLLFKLLAYWIFGPLGEHQTVGLHALGYAGWVGVLITALNLMPIGQLDGGHVLYALLREKAHFVATLLLGGAIVGVLWTQNYQWSLMLLLLILMGPKHPPTANDYVPLGRTRIILGWLTLSFVILGFTPTPFSS